jgi:hypothetical protein
MRPSEDAMQPRSAQAGSDFREKLAIFKRLTEAQLTAPEQHGAKPSLFGLPGNPVAVMYHLLVLFACVAADDGRQCQTARRSPQPGSHPAVGVVGVPARCKVTPLRMARWVKTTGNQGSGTSSMAVQRLIKGTTTKATSPLATRWM